MRRRAQDGQLPCAAAFAVAKELSVPVAHVGQAANELSIKIVDCQLGCFGKRRV
jgi:hypothetical protein